MQNKHTTINRLFTTEPTLVIMECVSGLKLFVQLYIHQLKYWQNKLHDIIKRVNADFKYSKLFLVSTAIQSMHPKFNAYFIISLLLFSMLPTPIVSSAPPILYNKELSADSGLTGAFFTNDNAEGFHVSFYGDSAIAISSTNHFTDKTIKIKGTALTNRLKMYDGLKVGITHINDDGTKDFYIKDLKIDNQGFAYLTTDFSTVIINGYTGYTTYTLTNQSGNWSTAFTSADVSSVEADITNYDTGHYTINGTDFTNRRLLTLNNSSEALTNFQVKKVQDYYSAMQVDMDDKLYTCYENDTLIPFWDEDVINSTNATNYMKIPSISTTTGAKVWMYYGNSMMNSASSISDAFEDGSEMNDLTGMTEFGTGSITDGIYTSAMGTGQHYGVFGNSSFGVNHSLVFRGEASPGLIVAGWSDEIKNELYVSTTDMIMPQIDHDVGITWTTVKKAGTITQTDVTDTGTTGLMKFELIRAGTTNAIFKVDDVTARDETSNVPIVDLYPRLTGYTSSGAIILDYWYVEKYTATKPTWATDGEEQTASGATNFTLESNSITNTTLIGTGNTSTLTVSPTTADSIYINTTSTDWGATVTKYWTEDTTLIEETVASGYVKQYINYTPSSNISSADLNTTITNDLTAHDYLGTTTSTLNDVSKTTIRAGQEVNASVGSLTKDVAYYWNITIPYNNAPTVGTITNTTAYIGIEKTFTSPSFTDPEALSIDTHYWQFGDGSTSSDQNPTHTYTTAGLRNANYTVTETATTSPQAVLREFTIDVDVQPPQNTSTIPHITNVSINWDDYTSADKYSVYEMEDGIPYVNTNPTIDGIKDTIYDNAHEFLIYAPNPVNPHDYETIYPIRTASGVYIFHESVDNDDKLGDDDAIYYFDLDNNSLTVDDPAWKITNNIVKKYLWNGASWAVTGVSNAVGDSTGGGTHYPKHELFIPIDELGANWTNGSTVKVLVKREDSDLSPDVITWFPDGNINNTDTSLWQEMVLNQPNTYDLLANVTLSNYTAIGLTPFTMHHFALSSWNSTDESSYTTIDAITQDIMVYEVSGYVFDDFGSTVAGATVWMQNGFVGEITTSDANGYYKGHNFHVGNYSIYANKTGYAQNFTSIHVTGNTSNVNITLPAYEMTDWILWNKLLEIEALLDVEESAPTEITKMTYQIFILLIIMDLLAVWYAFTHTDKSYYTDIIASLLAVIISGIISYNSVIGVSYYFATQSTVHEIEYTSVSLMILFSSVAGVMVIFFITKILELTHKELDQL